MNPFKRFAKERLQRYPLLWDSLRAVRFFNQCRARFGKFQNEFRKDVYGDGPITVLCGPFQGMLYFNKIVWGPITPKWVGSFESELHAVVSQFNDYDVIVDIGAAEGYYAIGLARVCPSARIVTYDIDFIARRRQSSLAQLNNVADRIDIRQRCDFASLNRDIANQRCLVITDIEGCEVELLDPAKVSNLRRSDLLVEIHQNGNRSVHDVAALMVSRFAETHRIEQIASEQRRTDDWIIRHQALRCISADKLAFAIDEFRYPQIWLWMRATGK